MAPIKGYKPPTAGDVCFIRKSFGEWSSGTRVTIVDVEGDDATVIHDPTGKIFTIDIDYLVKKRDRSGR